MSIFSRLGVPEETLTDQGRQFTSQYMKEGMNLLEINHLMTTPYHPMCNGLVESFNGTLKQMLRRMCAEQPKKWDQFIDPLLFAYREVCQCSTGFSPFELLYGRTVRGPLYILKELWTGQNEAEVQNSYQYVIRLKEKLESTMKLAQKELEKAQDRYKHHYDKKSKKKNIKIGDKVLVLLPTHRNKLMIEWKGPFLVTDEPYPNDFKILMNKKKKTYHVNLLKKYILRETETDPVILSAVINHEDFTSEEDDTVKLPTLSNQDSNAINKSSTVSQKHLSTEKKQPTKPTY